MEYLSLFARAECEKVIEKSRFLGYASHTEGEDEARAFLAEIRAKHPLATHVCWAFIADKVGNEQRFSDDGEPQGTAGMPILNVIKGQKLFETTVAVVRYFGGIKLGAGGLVRAYSSTASQMLDGGEKRRYAPCFEVKVALDYPLVDSALRFFSSFGVQTLGQTYEERAQYAIAVEGSRYARFEAELKDYLNGKVEIVPQREYFYPFPVSE